MPSRLALPAARDQQRQTETARSRLALAARQAETARSRLALVVRSPRFWALRQAATAARRGSSSPPLAAQPQAGPLLPLVMTALPAAARPMVSPMRTPPRLATALRREQPLMDKPVRPQSDSVRRPMR